MNEEIVINLNPIAITKKIQGNLDAIIDSEMKKNNTAITNSLQKLFNKELLKSTSDLDDQLEWAAENAIKRGFEKGVESSGLEDLVAEKTKELLADESVILSIAMKRIEQGFGIEVKK